MYECADCGSEQNPTGFDEDLLNAVNAMEDAVVQLSCIEQLDQPPRSAMEEAADGSPDLLCASCYADVMAEAREIVQKEQ